MSAQSNDFRLKIPMRQSSGFTLVELLVVIGIIALLISILLPALNKARQSGTSVQCESNLRQMGQAIVMYTGDFQGSLPPGYFDGASPAYSETYPPDGYVFHATTWSIAIQPYLARGGSTFMDNGANSNGGVNSGVRKVFLCPDVPVEGYSTSTNTITQYICHPRLMPWMQWWADNPDPISGKPLIPYKLSHVKRSSEIGMIFDAALFDDTSTTGGNIPEGWNVPSTIPVGYRLDAGVLGPHSGEATTYMTDDYGYSGNTGANAINPGQSINVCAAVYAPYTNYPNMDNQYNSAEIGPASGGSGNIRFRHENNTQCNVLMADGHVQVFNYKASTQTTDLLRGNINVNP
jgi:prepilin-type N-terminal cleavage/methylation domain-containing protein/prepilin-type processing-associated H-X9-DG protein